MQYRGADCMKNPLALLLGAVLLGLLLAHVEPSNGVCFYGGQIVRGLSVQIYDEIYAEARADDRRALFVLALE